MKRIFRLDRETLLVVLVVLVVAVSVSFGAMLTKGRNTPSREGSTVNVGVAASTKIYVGGMVAINSSNYAVPAAPSISNAVIGRSEEYVDNSSGSSGAKTITIGIGVYRYANQAGVGNVASADDIGKLCYVVDDQTVSLSSSSGTRPPAGRVFDVDSSGVWVDFRGNYPDGAFSSSQLGDGSVSLEHLDSGITPSHIPSWCNTTSAETDADASVTETHSSLSATDVLVAYVMNNVGALNIINAVAGSGTATFTLNQIGGANTRVRYCAFKAAQ